ncbi:MAG: arginase family protein [Planctomycetes bacterium]|nr:arginase family protein [Planctomycetota bacterium]
MKTSVIFFPFDLFGSSGSAAGTTLLADELLEVLADNRRETVATRAAAYTPHVRIRQFTFDTLDKYQSWRRDGRKAVRQALRRGDFLIWVAGNHLGALPVYDELAGLARSPAEAPLVVQFDAHLDVHHFADCTRELSHGNFLLHCAGPLPPLVNVGHRELLLPDDYVRRFYRAAFPASALAVDAEPARKYIAEACAAAPRIVLDIDCDVFDPTFFPAVSQPVPFGLSPQQVLAFVQAAWSERVAGVLLSEFDPSRDQHDRSLATLVWLLEYLLLARYESPRGG